MESAWSDSTWPPPFPKACVHCLVNPGLSSTFSVSWPRTSTLHILPGSSSSNPNSTEILACLQRDSSQVCLARPFPHRDFLLVICPSWPYMLVPTCPAVPPSPQWNHEGGQEILTHPCDLCSSTQVSSSALTNVFLSPSLRYS